MKKARAAVGKQTQSVSDLSRTEIAIMFHSQHAAFGKEIGDLQSGAWVVKNKSDIYKLYPVLRHCLLRVGGESLSLA